MHKFNGKWSIKLNGYGRSLWFTPQCLTVPRLMMHFSTWSSEGVKIYHKIPRNETVHECVAVKQLRSQCSKRTYTNKINNKISILYYHPAAIWRRISLLCTGNICLFLKKIQWQRNAFCPKSWQSSFFLLFFLFFSLM